MIRVHANSLRRAIVLMCTLGALLAGCTSTDGGGSTSVSVGVGVGYGGYYGPGYYGGYYEPYPPVIVTPPGERPDRPGGSERPTTLPAEGAGGPSVAPARPESVSRPTSRPSPRPASRPMPRRR